MFLPKAAAVAAAALLALAAPAAAHEGNPNFRSEITSITPADAGLRAEVLNYDDNVQLFNEGASSVLVRGYEDEPYLRIEPDGQVLLNRRSPAYYLNGDRFAETEVPADADPEAEPEWELVDRTGQFSWHDHRIHYMSRELPPQVTDEQQVAKIFDYSVPIEVGGREGELAGTLTWVGEKSGFPVAPFIGIALVALIGLPAAVIWRRRRDRASAPSGQDSEREAW